MNRIGDIMMWIENSLYVGGILMGIIFIIKSFRIYVATRERFYRERAEKCVRICENSLIKSEDFFFMRNDGKDLCDTKRNIKYIDCISECDFFMRK